MDETQAQNSNAAICIEGYVCMQFGSAHVKIFSNFHLLTKYMGSGIDITLAGSEGGFLSTGYAGNNACLLLVLNIQQYTY